MKTIAASLLLAITTVPGLTGESSLKEAYRPFFLIGAAVNDAQVEGTDPAATEIVERQFDSVTSENAMKWDAIHPRPGEFRFGQADKFIDFAGRNGMFAVGHVLVWHSQTPGWVFEGENGQPADRDTLLERMRDHIHAVVGRYRGRVKGWDVVNEAMADDGSGLRDSPWRRIIGDDYIIKAFEFAHEADPEAELYYNDYGIESGPKRAHVVALIKRIQDAGIPIAGVGIQCHMSLEIPSLAELDEAIKAYGELGLKVMITEMDVDVLPSPWKAISADVNLRVNGDPKFDPYTGGLPPDLLERQARRYAEVFRLFLDHSDVISRVTLWGVNDRDSWLNNFPIRGRTNYPLLYGRDGNPKPAYEAVIGAVESLPGSGRADPRAAAAGEKATP